MKMFGAILGVLVSFNVYAGGGTVGNGGVGIACHNSNGTISSLEILDFWEGRNLYNLKIKDNDDSYDKIMETELKKLGLITFGDKHQDVYLDIFNDRIQKKIVMLPDGVHLQLTKDINTVLLPPKNCEFVQIANYTNNGILYIDSSLWNLLNEKNKAGLLSHETLYWYLRGHEHFNNDQDSVRVRKTIAYLFAGNFLEKRFADLPLKNDTLKCYTRNYSLGHTSFYVYSNDKNELFIEYDVILSHHVIDRTYAKIDQFKSVHDFLKFEAIDINPKSLIDGGNFRISLENMEDKKDSSGRPLYTIYVEDLLNKKSISDNVLCQVVFD